MTALARHWPQVQAVVVGTSAGGVQALMRLVAALRPGFPAVVLVVLHRPATPAEGASPARLLASRCALPLDDAWHGQPLRPGQVLLAPADHHLLVDPGPVAALSRDAPVLWSRPAIDPLFESAALLWGPRLLALVLTGASSDGSLGALAVRRAGGRVWVQDPRDAAAAAMPQAALNLAGADKVLNMAEICRALRGAVTGADDES